MPRAPPKPYIGVRVVIVGFAVIAFAIQIAIVFRPPPGPRLHIISVTGHGKYEKRSIIVQRFWERRLGKNDAYTNVCDVDCGKVVVDGHRLKNILPMQDTVFVSARPIPTGYKRAQFKFVWGLIHEYRRISSEGGTLPRWWFVKDDDVIVHIDRLISLAARYDPNKRVFVGRMMPRNDTMKLPCNGYEWFVQATSGWLVSAAMAKALVEDHGDQWLELQEKAIKNGTCTFYDQWLPMILDQVGDSERVNLPTHIQSLINLNFSIDRAGHPHCAPDADLVSTTTVFCEMCEDEWDNLQRLPESVRHDQKAFTDLIDSCFDDEEA